ncbi:hypothetical protein PMI04_007735 [Sphingobium sp. AP49]|uniref:hypothetical protein n=1 Tax=Sphingobium sp. AP49 TaxID=1144307 RepID=UPI00026ECF2A|nr:hypothetical protein [Sphingobium sp. AP49]WHO40476.1 hypothetical protein PMI04_007735 [Sphingobium sp. AP49]
MAARKGVAKRERLVPQHQARKGGARLQQRRVRKDGWDEADRAGFLAELAETCNVSEAARTVQKSRQTAYALRRRDAAFARDWDAAIEQGYAEIEAMLIRLALHGCEREEIVEDGDGAVKSRKVTRAPNPSLGLQLLKLHAAQVAARRAVRGAAEGPGSADAIARVEQVLAEVRRRRAAAGT